MRRKKIGLIFLLVFCMLLPAGCRKEKEPKENEYRIYYQDAEEIRLVEEFCEVEGRTTEERIDEVLGFLEKTPDTIGYKSVFVSNVKVADWKLQTTKLDLYFNAEYRKLDTASEVMLRAAVVQSLVQVPGVSYVRFFVDGAPLVSAKGDEIGYMQGEDFVQNTGSSLHSFQTADLTLYFSNSSGDRLVAEKVTSRYNSNMSIEKLVVEKLLKGPSETGSKASIPAQAKLLSVSVKEHVCYVNFDEGFLNIAEQVNPKVTVYSLVNSLVDAGAANQVQILVNGETNIVYQETVDLSKPLTKDTEMIEMEEN